MKADEIRKIGYTERYGDCVHAVEDRCLREIAAQLAELNENVKEANQLQRDLFGGELK